MHSPKDQNEPFSLSRVTPKWYPDNPVAIVILRPRITYRYVKRDMSGLSLFLCLYFCTVLLYRVGRGLYSP